MPILMKKCTVNSTLIPMANCEPKLSLAIPEIRIPLAIIRLNKLITKELPIKPVSSAITEKMKSL